MMWLTLLGAALAAPMFPAVSGETLAGEALSLPAAADGKALILLGMGRDDQVMIDTWLPLMASLEVSAGLRYYEVALVDDVNFALKAVITAGMKVTLPDAMFARTMALFEAREPVLASLELSEGAGMQVLLVDGTGAVLWLGAGGWSEAGEASLRAALEE